MRLGISDDRKCWIYVAQRPNGGLLKIGFTTNSPRRRVCNLRQTVRGHRMELVASAECEGPNDETWLLALLRPYLADGKEWFQPHPDLVAQLVRCGMRSAQKVVARVEPHPVKRVSRTKEQVRARQSEIARNQWGT